MTVLNETPTFNLGVVTQETGIHPDTLRAWERRYGLPDPARTEGRHRLYSQRDIETIRWLLACQEEGMSISKAVKLWRTLEAEGTDPLTRGVGALTHPQRSSRVALPKNARLSDLRATWVAACLDFDEARARQVANHAFALFPAETVCFDILFDGLAEIGSAWYRGEATVQQEHFASGVAQRRISALIAAAPPPSRSDTVVVGCPPNEDHVLAALMITLLLRTRGWGVIYLGANVPVKELDTTVSAVSPRLAIFTAQQLYTAAALLDVAALLHRYEIPLAYGGWVFGVTPALQQRIPGYFLGTDLRRAADEIEKLLRSPGLATVDAPPASDGMLNYYATVQLGIESYLREILDGQMQPENLRTANLFWHQFVFAALKLGEINSLRAEIDWISGLLEHADIPAEQLKNYFAAYRLAAAELLGDQAEPVVALLDDVITGA